MAADVDASRGATRRATIFCHSVGGEVGQERIRAGDGGSRDLVWFFFFFFFFFGGGVKSKTVSL